MWTSDSAGVGLKELSSHHASSHPPFMSIPFLLAKKESRSQLSPEISSVTSLSFLLPKLGHNIFVAHPALTASGSEEHKFLTRWVCTEIPIGLPCNQLLVTGGVALMSFRDLIYFYFIFILLMTLTKARTLDFQKSNNFFCLFCFIFISSHRELISHKNDLFPDPHVLKLEFSLYSTQAW